MRILECSSINVWYYWKVFDLVICTQYIYMYLYILVYIDDEQIVQQAPPGLGSDWMPSKCLLACLHSTLIQIKNIKPKLAILSHLFKVPPNHWVLGPRRMTYRIILRGVGDVANRNTPIDNSSLKIHYNRLASLCCWLSEGEYFRYLALVMIVVMGPKFSWQMLLWTHNHLKIKQQIFIGGYFTLISQWMK